MLTTLGLCTVAKTETGKGVFFLLPLLSVLPSSLFSPPHPSLLLSFPLFPPSHPHFTSYLPFPPSTLPFWPSACPCRYKECRYPENMESLTISNTSIMNAEISFFFHKDHNGTTYLLDPSSMTLDIGESKVSFETLLGYHHNDNCHCFGHWVCNPLPWLLRKGADTYRG
jgi:hypothetical protein